MPILEVYADESCKDGHKYLGIGALAVVQDDKVAILNRLFAERAERSTWSEVKWTELRASKLPFYEKYINTFFEYAKNDAIHFHALYLDTATQNHKLYNEGCSDIGFDKVLFQLLLHKFGKTYGKKYEIHVYLDKRNSKQNPEILRPMLNDVLKRDYFIDHRPFRLIRFEDSEGCELIQIADLLTGAIATRKNGHHLLPNSSAHKKALGDHIAKQASILECGKNLEGRYAQRFTIWPFRYGP